MMMMQLESRLVLCEDIARQFVTYGFRETPSAICAKIDAISAEDIRDVAKRMLNKSNY
jgi:predicted Zn-dependent peptidase